MRMNPPDLPPADTVEKRRKQIEKAKAAHLSRQLQTRLQYARLKVDHGWQKQTLNEVENLYFHHYRARVSPRGAVKPEKGVVGVTLQGTSEPATAASTATQAPTVDTRTDQPQDQLPSDPGEMAATTAAGEEDSSAMDVEPPDQDSNVTQTEPATSDVQPARPPIPASPTVTPPSPLPPVVVKTTSPSKPSQPPLQPSPTPHTRQYSAPNPTSLSQSPKPSVNIPLPLSRNQPLAKHPSLPQTPALRLGGPTPPIRLSHSAPLTSIPGASPSVALTYDSFWSSHSAASTNYRSTITSTQSLNKGDASTALPNLETSYAFSMGAPNPSFEPLPLRKHRSLARKPAVTALRQTYSRGTGLEDG